jgi:hypothetical protein
MPAVADPPAPASAAPAPAAPAAPAPTPRAVSSPAQPQKRELNVSELPKPAIPVEPPKKGSARERLMKDLESRRKNEAGELIDKPATELKPAAKPGDADPAAPATPPEPATAPATAGDPAKKDKPNPWKLMEEHKARAAAAEQKLLDMEKAGASPARLKEFQEKLEAREKRLQELEEEIKYVNYEKSEEFKNKYQAPYEAAWGRAMSELGELTIEGPDGSARPLAAQDILELVNLPLGKAHELATEKFGELAPEVMSHRKEIRKLFDERVSALDSARKAGTEREKTLTAQAQQQYEAMSNEIKTTWTQANEQVSADEKYGSYFTPKEGDEQGNQRLAKGFELADRAFSENPLAPGLTAEQRQSIVRRHAAVRNRAAAFGRLVYQNNQAQARIAALEKELSDYKGSSPELKGSQPAPANGDKPTGMTGLIADLRKKARQI